MSEQIKSAFERISKTLAQKPSFGKGTGISRAVVTSGLSCRVTEGDYEFVADMPQQAGGNAAGPTPGVYGRAALGSCLAIGYMMRAAVMNVPITSLEVEIQADYDDGVLFGTVKDLPAGYLEVRYTVTVDSEAPQSEVMRVLDEADRHSPYLDVFSRAQSCKREVRILQHNHQ